MNKTSLWNNSRKDDARTILSTEFVMWMGTIINRSKTFQLVEFNLHEPEVRMHCKVINPYNCVQQINLPNLSMDYEHAKDVRLNTLDDFAYFILEVMKIFDSKNMIANYLWFGKNDN